MVCLTHGADSLIVAPAQGGAILGWTRNGRHLLRRPSPESVAPGLPGAMGCFPLVPYCNRIAHRRFAWDGHEYSLAANFGDRPHAIHGVGWQRPWQVEAVTGESIDLSLQHTPDASWPFAFSASLTYRLDAKGLTIAMTATNRHGAPAPMGIGAHPYFPRAAGDCVRFQAGGVWLNADSLPSAHAAIPAGWTHAHGRAVDREALDNCFTGWTGTAELPALTIRADAVFGNLQVFTPANADFFCVEPVSHVPDAFHLAALPGGQAMTVTRSGETLRGAMTFSPRMERDSSAAQHENSGMNPM